MKKNLKEIIILSIQLFIFYIFPCFMYLVEPIGTVMIMLLVTVILSIILATISKNKLRFLYSIIISIIFLPTVFIYYNESAFIHSIWYLAVSSIGILIGTIFKVMFERMIPKKNKTIISIILTLIIILIITLSIAFLYKKEFMIGEESKTIINNNGISLSIQNNTLTNTGLTLILKNDGDKTITYTEEYEMEIKKDNNWQKLNIEIDFITTINILNPKDSNTINIDWEYTYGKLKKGDYRIVKQIFIEEESGNFKKRYISEEFRIK